MALSLFIPLALTALSIVYYVIVNIRQAAKAKSFGCQPAPLYRPWDVFGLQTVKIELNGLKNNCLSDTFLQRKNEMSAKLGYDCKTFRVTLPPRDTWIYTFDPRNVQAVLATQFQDFQQPDVRVGAFQALLGLGIVRFCY
jgi:hypothetical protein